MSTPKKPTTIKPRNTTGLAGVLKRVRRGETLAKSLQKMKLIYSYGGGRVAGHITFPVPGAKWTDCSGFVTYVLDAMGVRLKNGAGSTWSLAEEGKSGMGTYCTLFIKNAPGDEHVIMRLRKRPRPWHFGRTRYRWVQCGGSDNPSAGGGPSFFIPGKTMGLSPEERIREFPIHRHFPELEVGSD